MYDTSAYSSASQTGITRKCYYRRHTLDKQTNRVGFQMYARHLAVGFSRVEQTAAAY